MKYSGPVTKIQIKDKKVILLGTAHVSEQSIKDVQNIIEKEQPNTVGVELCEARYKAIQDSKRWKNLDIIKVIKEKKLYLLMSNMILSAFQKKIGENTKIKPGEEMIKAIKLTKKNKLNLELVDRDIQVTLKRAWGSGGYWTKAMLISEFISSLMFTLSTSSKDIEEMKKEDMLDAVFKNLPMRYIKIKDVIITERDQYIAQKIKNIISKVDKNKKIVIIVGAGHLKGIQKYLKSDEHIDITKLEEVKQVSKIVLFAKFLIPILVITSLFLYFTGIENPQKIIHAWIAWSIIKSFCSGIFALVMLAHPLAILTAMLTAPISNFNPVLKPGWVAALFEAKFRKPKVSDFENFANDTSTLKGFFNNKVSRIFGIFMLPQLGSSLGTALALWYIA